MKTAVLALALSALTTAASAQEPAPGGLKPWQPLGSHGAEIMRLAGGLSTTDMTTFRVRYPAGFPSGREPHVHFATEQVTVLKGAIFLGFGDCFDEKKAVRYGPGSFFEIPAGQSHFEWFDGEYESQVTSNGPMSGQMLVTCKPAT
jgi:quercetin dioxygenase-like cupin family protein